MPYSRPCCYAIRALVYLATQPAGRMCLCKEIAKRETIPPYFLGKILGHMARWGLLRSAKGPNGGFLLAKPPHKITLYEIKTAVDGVAEFEECVAGLGSCGQSNKGCPIHETWKLLQLQIRQYFQQTTLADLVPKDSLKRGRDA